MTPHAARPGTKLARRRLLASGLLAMMSLGVASSGRAQEPLPRIAIIATGGTIAGRGASALDTSDYKMGQTGVEALLAAIPELPRHAHVTARQLFNVGSENIDGAMLLRLRSAVAEAVADPSVQGVVITHGTDTLEETAFFLDLTLRTQKPVVLVAAMRPATALSADGPMNLMQAVSLAGSREARGRGVLAVLNDRIASGYYVQKWAANAPDAFRGGDSGQLGVFIGLTPHFYFAAASPTGRRYFEVSGLQALPKVAVVYGHQGVSFESIEVALAAGARGIVMAGAGSGAVPDSFDPRIEALEARNIAVIRASRSGAGYVAPQTVGIGSGVLNPAKARLLLALALAEGQDVKGIRRTFERPTE